MVPVLVAHVWLVHELILSVKWVRRTMIEEERKRRLTLRRITARRQRAEPPRFQMPLTAATASETGGEVPFLSRADSRVTATKAVGAAIVAATASVAATSDSIESAVVPPDDDSPDRVSVGDDVRRSAGMSSSEDEQKSPPEKLKGLSERNVRVRDRKEESDKLVGGDVIDDESTGDESRTSRDVGYPSLPPSSKGNKMPAVSSLPHLRSPLVPVREQPLSERDSMSAVSARAVRISYLLQTWVRLWLTMSAFAIVVGVLLLLLFMRFCGISSKYLSASAIASPAIIALAAMAVHSFIMLDGDGGTGGGAALRSGGSRSFLALGRRPIIILALIFSSLLVSKLDAEEIINTGRTPKVLQAVSNRLSWAMALTPIWIAAALVEGVYLRALWESRTGQNCVSFFLGSPEGRCRARWFGSSCCLGCSVCCLPGLRWGIVNPSESDMSARKIPERDRSDSNSRPDGRSTQRRFSFHHQQRGVSFYSNIRWRAVLTPSQRAAAAAIAGGILFVVIALVACCLRKGQTMTPSWAIPSSMLAAALGEGLIGAGLWRLVMENCGAIRGGVPPAAKPLPVLYSEREGGWVVGPADPPMVFIFLLGAVMLRQEGSSGNTGRWAPSR